MQFVYPAFLFAGLSVAIPIVIHLFHFRRFRKVYFTNVRFLREVKKETSSRSRLRNLIVLICRCLALIFMALAFAQPFIPVGDGVKKGDQNVSIFVDNSFSMNAISSDAILLEKAKQKAKEIVTAYAETDRFQILTADLEGRHQRLVSKEDALRLVDEIRPSGATQELSKILLKQQQTLSTGTAAEKTAYFLSDFQKNSTDFQNLRDSVLDIKLIALQSVEQKNVAIDSVWFESPVQLLNQVNKLVIQVRNYGKEDIENIRLNLNYDGQEKPVGTLSVKANATTTDTIAVAVNKTGWHTAELTITDAPIQFDDHYFFTFNVPAAIKVAVLNEGNSNRFLDAALMGNRLLSVMNLNVGNLDYSLLAQNQFIILSGVGQISSGLATELGQFVKNGGSLVIFPAVVIDKASYDNFLNPLQANSLSNFDGSGREISTLNTNEFIFKDVYLNKNQNLKLPTTTGNFKILNRSGEALLSYRDGSEFLTKNKVQAGKLYLCAAPLDEKYSTLTRSGEVFVPMLYRMAISAGAAWNIAHIVGDNESIEIENKGVNSSETAFKMKGRTEEFIPEQRKIAGNRTLLGVQEGVKEAGIYSVYQRPDSSLYQLAFNYSRKESELVFWDNGGLKEAIKNRKNIQLLSENTSEANLTALVGERNKGISLWRWCLMLALVALAAEILFLRFWKV